jgi:hypothetical protein
MPAWTAVQVTSTEIQDRHTFGDTPDMSSAAAVGGAASQLASVMASAALQSNRLGLAEAQIDASDVAGGSAPAISPSAVAPGSLEVFA